MTRPCDILAADYRPMILSYLRTTVQDGHSAEDLIHGTKIPAHKSLAEFTPGGNSLEETADATRAATAQRLSRAHNRIRDRHSGTILFLGRMLTPNGLKN